ncbi:MAG: matrixin family metalloprotease, partial [Acidobacteriota bacterium]
MFLGVKVASAHFLGGEWASPSYTYYTTSYYSQVAQARDNWNNNTIFSVIETSPSQADVAITHADYGAVWDGYSEPGPDPDSGTYTYGQIRLNDYWLLQYTHEKRISAIAHEMGHMMGLAHYNNPNDHSIMHSSTNIRYDNWGLTGPAGHDISDVQQLY